MGGVPGEACMERFASVSTTMSAASGHQPGPWHLAYCRSAEADRRAKHCFTHLKRTFSSTCRPVPPQIVITTRA